MKWVLVPDTAEWERKDKEQVSVNWGTRREKERGAGLGIGGGGGGAERREQLGKGRREFTTGS